MFGAKIRFSAEAATEHQVVAGVALQLFTLGIPCIYYGTEQAFAGPEPAERAFLPVVVDLVRARWEYTESGVLDRTHVRFFTRG